MRKPLPQLTDACRKAEIGCVECKKKMAEFLIKGLEPIHEKRAYYLDHPDLVDDIFSQGNAKASRVARATMDEVRAAVSF
jgi:tryptophanyl-tRNA synthetase